MAATSLRDTLVSAAVLLILGSVAVVALNESRFQSRLLACQNNLRQIGQGLLAYSSVYEGAFVPIPREGNLSVAGAFAPILLDAGFLDDSALLFCSGGGSAAGTQRGIPSSDEVLAASGQRLVELQRRLAGDYGYTLGYYLNGSYQPASNMGRKWYVLVADAPASDQPGRQSANHGRRGQNCLFEDGRVQFVTGGLVPATTDAIYENDHGMVAPGLNPHDVVIAPSHVSPYPAGVVSSVAP